MTMTDNRPRQCAKCLQEADEGERTPGMVGKEYLPCEVCGEPACLDHAREFPTGFQHPECYHSPSQDRGIYGKEW